MTQHLRILSICGNTAVLEDGRSVRLGPVTGAAAGDYLEVYADLAISKSYRKQAKSIRSARKGLPQ